MKLKAQDLKAIKWYMETHDMKPALSLPPTIYMIPRKDPMMDTVKVDLSEILAQYNVWNEDDKKVRARERARMK